MMAKAVFRQGETKTVSGKVMISPPVLEIQPAHTHAPSDTEEDDLLEPEEEKYTGPTAEDLRREAEEFKAEWAIQKREMIDAAKAEANEIVMAADQSSSRKREEAVEEANDIRAKAQEEADQLVSQAKQQAEELQTETRKTLEEERTAAVEQGREAGRTEGYTEGMTEVERLVDRTRIVLERAQDKRGEILRETEQEIIDLVLLLTRKVVKVIADSQREVIVSNVIQALRKVRDRGNVIIRVNLADLKLTTEHTKDFIRMVEGVKSIQVQEDSSVGPGGCIIETDFGEIDARISSQLAELEAKILAMSPIKAKPKPQGTSSASATGTTGATGAGASGNGRNTTNP